MTEYDRKENTNKNDQEEIYKVHKNNNPINKLSLNYCTNQQ